MSTRDRVFDFIVNFKTAHNGISPSVPPPHPPGRHPLHLETAVPLVVLGLFLETIGERQGKDIL